MDSHIPIHSGNTRMSGMGRLALCLCLATALGGCGTMPSDRAVSGAGIGAGIGTVVGAVTGLSLLEGAALGAAAGGLTGVLTNDRQVNFGRPAWKQGSAADPRDTASVSQGDHTVTTIQSRLNALGYNAGRVDGRMGPQTREAICAYQRDNGLVVDGRATPGLAQHMWAAGS